MEEPLRNMARRVEKGGSCGHHEKRGDFFIALFHVLFLPLSFSYPIACVHNIQRNGNTACTYIPGIADCQKKKRRDNMKGVPKIAGQRACDGFRFSSFFCG